jgi:aryl-alcohol dehydrogenase-like predicted oxidoreductase
MRLARIPIPSHDNLSAVEINQRYQVSIRAYTDAVAMNAKVEFRFLGRSGFRVPALSFGTGTFGGRDAIEDWGTIDTSQASRMIDLCLESGVSMFDSADIYAQGNAERMLGSAIRGRRDKVIISTKLTFRSGPQPNDVGSSRFHMLHAIDAALERLGTDYIDILQMHGFDAMTPVDEVLYTLDCVVRAGKIRYIGASNFCGWQLMKSLAVSEHRGYPRYVANQVYYSLVGRDFEWELMPLALDQGVGTIVWSPLGWGQLSGKIRRGVSLPDITRWRSSKQKLVGARVSEKFLFRVVEVLDEVAKETGKSIPQIAINWVMHRPSVASVIIGARNEEQLRDNLGAIGWTLSPEHVARLDAVTATRSAYPHWYQRVFTERIPIPVGVVPPTDIPDGQPEAGAEP